MSFIITKTEIIEKQTLKASVIFKLKDGTELPVDVSLFCPLSKEDVLKSIANREDTEQRKYDALTTNTAIKSDIDNTTIGKAITVVDGKITIATVK